MTANPSTANIKKAKYQFLPGKAYPHKQDAVASIERMLNLEKYEALNFFWR